MNDLPLKSTEQGDPNDGVVALGFLEKGHAWKGFVIQLVSMLRRPLKKKIAGVLSLGALLAFFNWDRVEALKSMLF